MNHQQIIESVLGTKCIKLLGTGSHGQAWLTEQGTVAKVTDCDREAFLFYLKLNDIKFEGSEILDHVCDVYGVWKIDVDEYNRKYIIEREYLTDLFVEDNNSIFELSKFEDSVEHLIQDIHSGNVGYKNGALCIFDAYISYDVIVDENSIPSLSIQDI